MCNNYSDSFFGKSVIEILKKTLYLCACFISSFALSFVIIYFILVFKLSSKNAAFTISALTGICLAAFFTLVNSILRCRKEAKLNEKALRYARIQHLTLLERREFFSVFISCFNIKHARQRGCCIYTKHSLWIISRKSSPLNAEDAVGLIQIRNAYPDKAATVCVLGGTDTAAAALMSENGCTIMPSEDLEKLIFFLPDDAISACTPKSSRSNFKQRFCNILLEKKFSKRCLRSALFLGLVSFLSRKRLLYLIAALILLGAALASGIYRRLHSSSIV